MDDGPTDPLADQLEARTAALLADWLAQIRAMLDGADSLEEFRERLLAAYPDLGTDGLTNAMALAYATAHLAGMSDVADETG